MDVKAAARKLLHFVDQDSNHELGRRWTISENWTSAKHHIGEALPIIAPFAAVSATDEFKYNERRYLLAAMTATVSPFIQLGALIPPLQPVAVPAYLALSGTHLALAAKDLVDVVVWSTLEHFRPEKIEKQPAPGAEQAGPADP
jgi:hypothetical protein